MFRSKYALSILVAGTLLITAMPAQAAALTSAQVSAVVHLLQSFGADASTVTSVQMTLSGSGMATSSPVSSASCSQFTDLHQGIRSVRVSQLQKFLGSLVTGYYGPITQKAWNTKCGTPQTTAALSADPSSGAAPLSVQFIGSGLMGGSQYIIDYGDGTTSGALAAINVCMGTVGNPAGCPRVSVSHIYSAAGSYTATLSPYIACMYTNPHCMIAVMPLARATVTVTGTTTSPAPSMSSITPSSARVGTQITITGSGFTASNVVHFGSGGKMQVPSSNNGTTITYTIPSSVGPCDVVQTFAVCAMYQQLVTPGTYSIYVNNENGQSLPQQFTVTQ